MSYVFKSMFSRSNLLASGLTAAIAIGAGTAPLLAMADPKGQPASAPATPTKAPADSEKKKEKPAATLKVGDAAPEIKIDKWVKGDEVKSFESGKVYAVEFWATWCPPCVKSIPHLTDLQKKHKDDGLTIIGVAASERQKAKGQDTRLANLENFVKGKGDQMNYAVAYDSDREMATDWMRAAGQTGIPTVFIVGGDGKVAWIGYPMDDEFDTQVQTAVDAAKKMSDKDKKKKDEPKKDGAPAAQPASTPAEPTKRK